MLLERGKSTQFWVEDELEERFTEEVGFNGESPFQVGNNNNNNNYLFYWASTVSQALGWLS